MPLETATYVSQLVTTNPVHTDGLNAADSHMRLIKAVLQAQFPNFTAAALTSTQAQIDASAIAVNTNGISILADTGVHFKTNTNDKITNPGAGEVDIVAGGNATLKTTAADVSVNGTLKLTDGSPTTAVAIDYSTVGVTVSQGGNQTIPARQSILVIVDTSAGDVGIFLIGGSPIGSSVTLLSSILGKFVTPTASPAAGHFSVQWNGSAPAIYNNYGSNVTFKLLQLAGQ